MKLWKRIRQEGNTKKIWRAVRKLQRKLKEAVEHNRELAATGARLYADQQNLLHKVSDLETKLHHARASHRMSVRPKLGNGGTEGAA